ncbi:tRNA lysidine(34) synthetase TilS [Sphingosinicella terrae]|jgi:tRNA(Ile)-lysidine synthase|uniref:tRNA lysidine(34) synthetase TilS n=1 Tax=Sphingosinicella terrae TaxID=2172047 RepID=UPI000E0D76BB|nr:tRNA lysidine(34) synthetase TilS [Sphingosinicella terrae]
MRPLPPELVQRFSRDLASLAGDVPLRIGVAVSGGPDSLALLLLAHAARPGAVEAATVDHGLRPEAAAEAEHVAALCARLDIAHETLRPASPIRGNVQSGAREARYLLLETWRAGRGLDWLLTGHHADDQAETLLMRLNRGAGIGGLGAVRAVNERVLRPLLGWRRAELAAIARTAGVDPVEDPSNFDPRFDRARLRSRLAEAEWIDPLAMTRSAQALSEANAALDWAADRLIEERVAPGDGALDPTGLPSELRRRLVLRMLRRINPAAEPRGDALTRLLQALDAGKVATLAGVRCRGGARWSFAAAPARRSG